MSQLLTPHSQWERTPFSRSVAPGSVWLCPPGGRWDQRGPQAPSCSNVDSFSRTTSSPSFLCSRSCYSYRFGLKPFIVARAAFYIRKPSFIRPSSATRRRLENSKERRRAALGAPLASKARVGPGGTGLCSPSSLSAHSTPVRWERLSPSHTRESAHASGLLRSQFKGVGPGPHSPKGRPTQTAEVTCTWRTLTHERAVSPHRRAA